jgi:hypothetical protein
MARWGIEHARGAAVRAVPQLGATEP